MVYRAGMRPEGWNSREEADVGAKYSTTMLVHHNRSQTQAGTDEVLSTRAMPEQGVSRERHGRTWA